MHNVAIPTDDGRTLSGFGRAKMMVVLNVENGTVMAREERPSLDPEHLSPAHHKLMMDLVRDCDVVVAGHMGPPMVRSLTQVGKRVLHAPSDDLETSIRAYLASEQGGPSLPLLTVEEAQAGHDHHDETSH